MIHLCGASQSNAQNHQHTSSNASLPAIRSEIEKQVTPYLHPFITTPSYRDVNEDIIIKEQSLEIWRLDNLETGLIENKLCQATRHLLFGRLDRSQGLQALLKANSQIQDVHWILYRVKTQVTPDLNNQYQQTRQPVPVAKISISRKKALLFDPIRLKKMLKGQACTTTAKLFVDEIWLNDQVKTRRKQITQLNIQKQVFQQSKSNQQHVGSMPSE